MGGEGSIMGMIVSFRNNLNELKNRRKPFNKDKLEGFPNRYHRALRVKRISKVQLEKLRRKLRYDRREETLKLIFALITSVGIAFTLIYLAIKVYERLL